MDPFVTDGGGWNGAWVRGESVLYVRDLASGAESPIWDGLDHDQQEAWAIFGVYPNFAWTADSRDVILWAGGGLVRVNTATRAVTDIPFEAEVEPLSTWLVIVVTSVRTQEP